MAGHVRKLSHVRSGLQGLLKMENEDIQATQDLLGLVSLRVSAKEIKSWSTSRRLKIEHWAAKVYLRASDNNVRIPPKPKFKSKRILNFNGQQMQFGRRP